MGSTGTGKFGDYQPGSATRCDQAIDSDLEDVATSEHYVSHQSIPPVGTTVRLRKTLTNGRLVAEDTKTGIGVGNLPTRFNYLLLCLRKGYQYEGTVSASSVRPVHKIDVHLDPI